MLREFKRVAIVNRGEAAMRLIRAVRELNEERGLGLETVALYTAPDRRAMFVRQADDGYNLGPATFVDRADGGRKSTYLNYHALETALRETQADAAWVGWGFVAEHAAFADLCARLDVVFIGPGGEVIRRLGDKIEAKRLAERAGVPVAPWSGEALGSLVAAKAAAGKLGFPLMLKASAGGGGRGIRVIRTLGDLDEAFDRARTEATQAFGDGSVFLERMVGHARHIEVQVIADQYGNAWAAGVRDCSLQRRNQKIIEESGSTALTEVQHQQISQAAVRLVKAADYSNAGTVEFLYDLDSGDFSFMEVNARLQVEHPVTEFTTGLDLVKMQIDVARGEALQGQPPAPTGWAIEARLNAEDPANGFMPAPGRVALFSPPLGPAIRVDTGLAAGDEVPADFDSMVGKILAWGHTRDEAMGRLKRALQETTVVIEGGTTNKAFLLALLNHPDVEAGRYDIAWLGRECDTICAAGTPDANIALLQAAIEVYDAQSTRELAAFRAITARGRPEVRGDVGYQAELRFQGNTYNFAVERLSQDYYRIAGDGKSLAVCCERFGSYERRLTVCGRSHRVIIVEQGADFLIEIDSISHRVCRDDGGVVRAPAPAMVLSINVEAGQAVEAGDRLMVLEAMKMEMPITAPTAGTVTRLLVAANVQVPAGQPLLELEPQGEDERGPVGRRVMFTCAEADPRAETPSGRLAENQRELCALTLGFDVDPHDTRRLVTAYEELIPDFEPGDSELLARERELLSIFVDIAGLFRRRAVADEAVSPGERSPEEYLHTYLRTLDTRGLPEGFLSKLDKALSHYGVSTSDSAGALAGPLMRMVKAYKRLSDQRLAIAKILERWLSLAHDGGTVPWPRAELDRLIDVSRRLLPDVANLAVEVRYQCHDRRRFDRANDRTYEEADAHLEALVRAVGDGERSAHMQALVDCPLPLEGLLSARFEQGDVAEKQLHLELALRRYYRIRRVRDVTTSALGVVPVASARYDYRRKRVRAFAAYAPLELLEESVGALSGMLSGVSDEDDVVVDLHVRGTLGGRTDDDLASELLRRLQPIDFGRGLRRLVLVVTGTDGAGRQQDTRYLVYRQSPDGSLREEVAYRGLHPMMGKRLETWRMEHFNVQRLDSPEDVYLFQCLAKENPKDERLIVFAECRELSPIRHESGHLVGLPGFERVFLEALTAIRNQQARRADRARLMWNRVYLHIWPPIPASADDLQFLVRRLAPATEGLGLEKVIVVARLGDSGEQWMEIANPDGTGVTLALREPHDRPLEPLERYQQQVVRLRSRGLTYPYEIVRMLTPSKAGVPGDFPPGEFVEYDFDAAGKLAPTDRPHGHNRANIVVGVITNTTEKYPEGMARVAMLSDPSRAMGAIAEPECSRLVAALDLAEERGMPVEWYAVCAGATIAMDTGTENLDWTARVIRRLIEFTQAGGEVNVLVLGINVGAQSYWNAEAAMLMHTKGIIVMIDQAAMVLTGKRALEYSGSVAAENNFGIGGYDLIMGPNGEAQYWARDVSEACLILLRHYDHAYKLPHERFPRRAESSDPVGRDVSPFPHGFEGGVGFATVGDVFADETNPGRKKPFSIRRVMAAVADSDHPTMERWGAFQDAQGAVVWDAHLGGWPVCLIGIESQPLQRMGFVPADGPDRWTAGTLFPMSSKKVARAINSCSGSRPVVILANLSGFDGSPESMRKLQLEYGAEIGRSVVNFDGPIVFCVVSRYHGGAYVVFSNKLNEDVEVAALEGAYASVIGGAPAAAVVFAREVKKRTAADPRIVGMEAEVAVAQRADKPRLQRKQRELWAQVHAEKLGQVAEEFDNIHTVDRAKAVGSVDVVVNPARLRPYLIDAVGRGVERVLGRSIVGGVRR